MEFELVRRKMLMLDLSGIQSEIDRLAAQIGASGYILPTYGHSDDCARPHIEVDNKHYHYVVVERGTEQERTTTENLNELLYHVFDHVTFSMACIFELAHRVKGQDFRRLLFQHQIELLERLSPEWAQRHQTEHEQILRNNPFDDLSDIRGELAKTHGWRVACETYPLPNTSTQS